MSESLRTSLTALVNGPAFLARYRGYAAVLAQLCPVEDRGVAVMAVSLYGRRFFLHVNVDFFLGRALANMKYFPGVLLHEVHHVVLGHLTDPGFFGPDVRFADLMELAMEISANEYISEELPGTPPRWNDFQHLGIAGGQSTRERYRLLEKARRAGRPVELPPLLDTHLPFGVGRGDAGGPAPSRLRVLLRRAVAALERTRDGDGARALVAGKSLAELLRERCGLAPGTEPGGFLELLDETMVAPRRRLDWRTALRLFTSSLRTPGLTYQRPNRRCPGLVGRIPGRSRFLLRDKPRLLAAIDTSGSMGSDDLAEIAHQLRSLGRLAKVTVVECDAAIQRVYDFPGPIESVAGRGGTDFRPVFAADFLRQHRPDGVVWFTDGCGPFPDEPPPLPTLWVLTSPSPPFPCPWGQQVFLHV